MLLFSSSIHFDPTHKKAALKESNLLILTVNRKKLKSYKRHIHTHITRTNRIELFVPLNTHSTRLLPTDASENDCYYSHMTEKKLPSIDPIHRICSMVIAIEYDVFSSHNECLPLSLCFPVFSVVTRLEHTKNRLHLIITILFTLKTKNNLV